MMLACASVLSANQENALRRSWVLCLFIWWGGTCLFYLWWASHTKSLVVVLLCYESSFCSSWRSCP